IDWSGVGQAAAGLSGGGGSNYNPGMLGGLGGLGGAPYTPSSSIGWTHLFGGGLSGGGGARADPYPGMSTPGGLSSPMTMPQQQQPAVDPYPSMSTPGGLGSPMTTPQLAYDYGSLFGRGVGGAAGGQPSGTSVFDTGAAPI